MLTLQVKRPKAATTLHRVAVCKERDIPLGLGRSFQIGGRLVAVFKSRDGSVFAMDGTCPHKGGPLADGMVVGRQVVCPLHAYRYEAHTGACDSPGLCAVDTFPTEVEGDTVFIVIPGERGA